MIDREDNDAFELLYGELHRIASDMARREPGGGTLQPTALLHEAWLRLARESGGSIRDREHLKAVASLAMRRVAVDAARKRLADKRGGGWQRVTLSGASRSAEPREELDILDLHAALERLEAAKPRLALLVEMRFFGGLSMEQVAEVLGVSESTAYTDWRAARAWLSRELSEPPPA